MAAKGHKHSDKKQSRSQRRRDMENSVFEELAELLPLPQAIKQDKLSILRCTVAYLKLRGALETDEQDLEDCLAALNNIPLSPSPDPSPTPLAMLDSDGNLVAGSLNTRLTTKDSASTVLSDTVVSELEKSFLSESKNSDNADINILKEKFQKYKEGLETGMQEFLNQDSSHIMFETSNSTTNDPALEGTSLICHKSTNRVVNTATKYGTARYSLGRENRICRTFTDQTKSRHPGVSCDGGDNSLALIHSVPEGNMSLEAASGFIMSLDKDKRVLFVTENVSEFLGLSQWSMIGQDVSEFVYEKDYPELERQMSDTQFNTAQGTDNLQPWQIRRTFYMAMNFCFQKPGSRLKDCGFQMYQWNAKLRLCRDPSTGKPQVKGLVSLCCPLHRDAMLSQMDSGNFFMIKYSLKDSRILFCDPKIQDLLGYSPTELIGIKHSDLKHPSDLSMCRYNYRNLSVDGKCESAYYRLLSRVGIWVWMYSNLSIVYNKVGEPEVLTVKNIIVSQEEAQCVLSREKRDYQRIQVHGTNDIFSDGMPASSIAVLKFQRARKKRKPFVDTVYTTSMSREGSSNKSKSAELPSEKIPGFKLERKCVKKLTELRKAALKQATHYGKTEQLHTELKQCSTQDLNVDTLQGSASNTLSVSPKEQAFAAADSDRFIEMLLFDQLAQDISAVMSPSRRVHANSAAEDWSLDALLFDDSQDGIISLPSNNSDASMRSSHPLEKLTAASGEANVALLNSNNQKIQLQINSAGQDNTDISPVNQSGNPYMSTQEYSNLPVSDDHCLDNIIDYFDESTASQPIRSFVTVTQPNRIAVTPPQPVRSSFATSQPITPSITVPQPIGSYVTASQPIRSSVTAPQPAGSSVTTLQPIRSKQKNKRLLHSINKPDFQTSETNYNNTDWLHDNLINDTAPNVISQETIHSSISSDCLVPNGIIRMDNYGLYSLLCDAPPVVSDESDIIFSPGKLDYPPFQSTLKANQGSGNLDEHSNINYSGFTKQAVAIATSCKQSIHQNQDTTKKGTGFNQSPGNSTLGFPETLMGKIQYTLDHQTLQFQEKEKNSSSSQDTEHTLADFYETVSHKLSSEDIYNYLINANISVMTTSNPASKENLTEIAVQQDLRDSASKLPEDLLDLELDCDWLNS